MLESGKGNQATSTLEEGDIERGGQRRNSGLWIIRPLTTVPSTDAYAVLLWGVFLYPSFPCGSAGIESALQCRRPEFNPWVGKIPWRRERLPTPAWRIPWTAQAMGCKESGTTERLSLHFLYYICKHLNMALTPIKILVLYLFKIRSTPVCSSKHCTFL